MAIHATGAGELHRIAAMCRAVSSDGQIARDVTTHTRTGGPQIRAAFKANTLAVLPHRGGLNAWVADSRMTFRAIRGANRGGMTVTVSKAGHDLDGLDAGLVIHPGNRYGPGWYEQGVPPESISAPIRDTGGSILEAACESALENAARRIVSA